MVVTAPSAAQAAPRPWLVVVRCAAALAAAMGVGRFVFTPILPLMEAQAHLQPAVASFVATTNYLGYLVGAVLGIILPGLAKRRSVARVSAVALVASLAGMAFTENVAVWAVARGIAGIASALIFIVASHTILSQLGRSRPQLVGWAYGGVGAGIALSGLLVAVVGALGDWRATWWAAAVLAMVLLAAGWMIGDSAATAAATPSMTPTVSVAEAPVARPSRRRWFVALTGSYFFEGAGYIVAGTFLVAAITSTGPMWLAHDVWTIAGLAAIPSAALWTGLTTKINRPTLTASALVLQVIGVTLPALTANPVALVVSAVLFGGTFVGITTLSLAVGRQIGGPRAIAVLTAVYGVGQVLGPLIVAPTLGNGYRAALLVGAVLVLVAAICATLLRIRFPRDSE